MTIDIKTLKRLADPSAASAAAANGLPTIDLNSFKANVTKMMEIKAANSLHSATNMVSSIMDSADSMINSHMDTMDSLVSAAKKSAGTATAVSALSSNTSITEKAANSLNAATSIAKLKQAKEHALTTGNFIPLLALTQPELSLKSLPKDLVVLPSLPDMPSISSVKDSIVNKIKG